MTIIAHKATKLKVEAVIFLKTNIYWQKTFIILIKAIFLIPKKNIEI